MKNQSPTENKNSYYSHSLILNNKRNAKITGLFFIAATVFAITGLSLYDPLLNEENFLIIGDNNTIQMVLGAICELILVASMTGTAIMLYPYLKRYNNQLGLGYLCFRLFEALFISFGIISMLALLSLSRSYNNSVEADFIMYQTIGNLLKAIYNYTFIIGPHFMLGINTFIYSYIFYKSNLVPKKLAILGLIGAVLIFIVANLKLFNILPQLSSTAIALAIPVAFYEMILATWLIRNGFNLR
ncbi:DUF4386 domain-containing protein [Flavobacterium sp. NG2]|uniref:DUF4386 domain-containing protein n=1 Tax=Flavobacterium sp. NG2 TaxID=3097547 RepID=UPI002A83EB3D|nr:DUF4386 domain-containing protein [Flavobacterium sp. NG2]WPR70316.1 DUF4386 domain-containing protein [Flavobacterium sp. NG2]